MNRQHYNIKLSFIKTAAVQQQASSDEFVKPKSQHKKSCKSSDGQNAHKVISTARKNSVLVLDAIKIALAAT